MSLMKRLNKEIKELAENPLTNCTAGPAKESDLAHWNATIIGPDDTPYAGGLFRLEIVFSQEYPFKPPTIKFKTRIYHPNISENGTICLDILKNKWSPVLTIGKVLLSLSSLLSEPNPNDPLVPGAANLYLKNPTKYQETAREWTVKYAT